MHFTSLVAAASVASIALAAPAPAPIPEPKAILEKRSFSVQRIKNTNAGTLDPKVAMRKAFEKHGLHYIILDPTSVSSASEASSPFDGSSSGLGSGSGSGRGTRTSGSGAAALRSWLSSIFSSATPVPGSGSGSGGFPGSGSGSGGFPGSGTGSGSGSSRPAPAEPSPTAEPSQPTSGEGAGSAPTSAPPQEPSSAPSASAPAPAPPSGTAGGVTGEATTNPESKGAFYLTPVQVGGQTLNLNLDTGSADLWVFDSRSASAGGKGIDPASSSSFKPIQGASFQIKYGDGSGASGSVGTNVVSIGKATVQNQAVEIATQTTGSFQDDTVTDGLLGLGFSNVNSVKPRPQKTFFDNIKPQLEQPLFTVTLNEDSAGEYEFGTIDQSKYTGEIHYTDVNPEQGYWQFPSTSFQVDGKTTQNAGAADAIADTGTSLLLVDDAAAKAYYAAVPNSKIDADQGGYVFPCGTKLPSFAVALGTTDYYVTVPGSELSYAPVTAASCFGGIQSNQGQKVQIFGDVLLKAHFAVFDGGENGAAPRFGVADRTANPTGKAPAKA